MKFFILFFSILFCNSAMAETIQLTPDNTYVYRGVVDANSVTVAEMELQALQVKRGADSTPLYLVLDCPGGSVYDGENFIQFAKTIPNLNTVSIFAASMCSGIAEAIPGKRYVTENGILMFHRAKGQFEGQFETGEVETQLAFWKSMMRRIEQRSADRMGISLKKYKAHVVNEYWLEGANAVKAGAADAQIDLSCSKELIEKTVDIVQEDLFGTNTFHLSACPLFRNPLP